jgi:integrase/recombinase XerD
MRPNKQANLICPQQEEAVLRYLTATRNPQRDRALFLLALKAGLNARDIAALTWSMVTDPDGPISHILSITIQNTWGIHHRHIPMHPTLRAALIDLYEHQKLNVHPDEPMIYSIRSKGLSAATGKDWFRRLYQALGMEGYASMSVGAPSSRVRPRSPQRSVVTYVMCDAWPGMRACQQRSVMPRKTRPWNGNSSSSFRRPMSSCRQGYWHGRWCEAVSA